MACALQQLLGCEPGTCCVGIIVLCWYVSASVASEWLQMRLCSISRHSMGPEGCADMLHLLRCGLLCCAVPCSVLRPPPAAAALLCKPGGGGAAAAGGLQAHTGERQQAGNLQCAVLSRVLASST
jgi:hypothetical protein